MGVLSLATLVGLAADDRILNGAPIWLKPLHFAFSLAVYSATLAWLLPRIRRHPRTAWWAGTLIAVSSLAEAVIISVQAWRGTYSHFNTLTPTNTAFMNSMTVAVVVLWTSNFVAAVVVLRDRSLARPLRLAVRLGLVLAVVGMSLGFLMNIPTPEQQRAVDAGLPTLVGAHNVGVDDGGPGMPLTNWSTVGGDLRIPHFVGIHALQVIPLAGAALALAGRRRTTRADEAGDEAGGADKGAGPGTALADEGVQARLVLVTGGAWTGLLALVTWQALRGQSLVHPDAVTLGALGALVLAVAAATAVVLRGAPRPGAPRVPASAVRHP
ncbi:hypothetical protein [Streptomyces liangshanensis]|uniref:Uncharacterized protein n=1 Tax=Streptomyces liangshanensis TaxID=2717324 RepID=A0A6G9GZ88_9ACTN|nr:hypothetical protein [Streptomyces liangshanensis]QIQ03301.1 hypothetical protein HA039_14010 [Streptomyces liangshanensis]